MTENLLADSLSGDNENTNVSSKVQLIADSLPANLETNKAEVKEEKITKPKQRIELAVASEFFDVNRPITIEAESFPDTKKVMGNMVILKTLPNTAHMLTSYGISANYDVITKDYVISIPGFKACPDNYDNAAITTLCSLATLNGIYSGQFISQVFAIASKCQTNPVMNMIKSKSWDGKDRLNSLYATITVKDEFPDDLKITLIRKWLLSAVAAASMHSGFSSRGVLTFQGAQSMGKTRWIASLVTDKTERAKLIKLDVHMDAGNKDSVLLAIRHWIVEIGELDSSFRKDIARLKGFLTNDKDKIRQPYDRKESSYQRRTVFCATVNANDFLIDSTGNTRFWTIPCIKINYNHEIDMQQVWAQLHQELSNSPDANQWWLTPKEEERLEHFNKSHRAVNAISDLLSRELDFSADQLEWEKHSAGGLLKEVGIERPTNGQTRECGAFLREKVGEPKKVKGYMCWLVPPLHSAKKTYGYPPVAPSKKYDHPDETDDY